MNKKIVAIIITAGALVAAGVIAYFLLSSKSPTETPTSDASGISESQYKIVKACDVLTLDEAKTIMGDSTTTGNNTDPVTNESISVDTCSYTNNATTVSEIRIATVMVRSALDLTGQESNQAAFAAGGAANPSGAEAVSGYGEKAFWDPATHQLAILDGTLWISIVFGSTNPMNNTLDDAKKVADFIVD